MGTTSSIGFVGFHLSTSLYNQQPTLSNFLPDSLALIYQQKESADMTETTRPGRLAGKTALITGPLNTPLLQDWLGDDLQKRHRREVHFPTGRFGEAIEQAQAVLFLASDESSFVNATEFVVDGGL